MAINQKIERKRVLNLPSSNLVAGSNYELYLGGGVYRNYVVNDSLQLVAQDGKEFIECNTVDDLRSLDSRQIWAIQNGYYKGVKLNGYYSEGDTPAPIEYYLSDTTEEDDGGSVFEVGSIKLEHDFKDSINLVYYGLKDNEDIYPYYTKVVSKYRVILIESGSYITTQRLTIPNIDGFEIRGINGIATITSINNQPNTIIGTPTLAPTEVPQSHPLMSGGDTVQISNHSLDVGDFVRFSSTRRFTEEWDLGTAIRAYYLDSELFKVKHIDGDTITFDNKSLLNFPMDTAKPLQVFKPLAKNLGLFNIRLKHNSDNEDSYSYGFFIEAADGFTFDNLSSEKTNIASMEIKSCYNVQGGSWESIGFSANLGTNYGIVVTDGTKFVNINTMFCANHRHALAGGGNIGVSMYVNVNSIFVRGSQSHSVDTHANCAFWTVKSADVDNFYSMSGIGHRMENINSINCNYSAIAIEGGKNLFLGKAVIQRASRFTIINPIIESQIDHLEVNFSNTIAGTSNLTFFNPPVGSRDYNIGTIIINNKDFDINKSPEENYEAIRSTAQYPIAARAGYSFKNIYIQGMQRGIQIVGANVVIDNVTMKNTGWSFGSTSSNILQLNEGYNGVVIKSGSIDNVDLLNAEWVNTGTTVLRMAGGTATTTYNHSVSNISYKGLPVNRRVEISIRIRDYILSNNNLGDLEVGGSDIFSSQYGIRIGNNFSDDTYSGQVPDASTLVKGLVNQASAVGDVTTADATDEVTAIALANANKAKINEFLAALRTAGILAT